MFVKLIFFPLPPCGPFALIGVPSTICIVIRKIEQLEMVEKSVFCTIRAIPQNPLLIGILSPYDSSIKVVQHFRLTFKLKIQNSMMISNEKNTFD